VRFFLSSIEFRKSDTLCVVALVLSSAIAATPG